MSLITCTSDCVYQQDGYCGLARAGSCGVPDAAESCVNYIPRRGAQNPPSVDTAGASGRPIIE